LKINKNPNNPVDPVQNYKNKTESISFTMTQSKINLALVCTIGGHFEQLTNLSEFYNRYNHFWITNRNKQTLSALMNERKYFVSLAHYKIPWTYLYQLPFFTKVFAKEKPTHILSTGSGRTAFIPFILSKVLRIKFIYIDTFSRVYGYSKFGSFLLKIGGTHMFQKDRIQARCL